MNKNGEVSSVLEMFKPSNGATYKFKNRRVTVTHDADDNSILLRFKALVEGGKREIIHTDVTLSAEAATCVAHGIVTLLKEAELV